MIYGIILMCYILGIDAYDVTEDNDCLTGDIFPGSFEVPSLLDCLDICTK